MPQEAECVVGNSDITHFGVTSGLAVIQPEPENSMLFPFHARDLLGDHATTDLQADHAYLSEMISWKLHHSFSNNQSDVILLHTPAKADHITDDGLSQLFCGHRDISV